MLTAYVPLGSKTIAGVLSEGMLASASELGISRDHAGIIELSDCDQQLPPPDHVIDIDNKSITHRPDLWGHHGMAREVAAITGKTLRDPVNMRALPPLGGHVQVEIENLHLCPRYSALVFENVKVQPSPLWLQQRLTAIGLNPISNIVDLTMIDGTHCTGLLQRVDADWVRLKSYAGVKVPNDGLVRISDAASVARASRN